MASQLKIVFFGPGNLASAIARGAVKSGVVRYEDVLMKCRSGRAASFAQLQAEGFEVAEKMEDVQNFGADIHLLSVKPQGIPSVLKELALKWNPKHKTAPELPVIGCTAMGVSLEALQTHLQSARFVRVMTNTSSSVCGATTAFVRGIDTTDDDVTLVRRLFASIGGCEELSTEQLLDQVTSIAGSGPAFAYLFIEAFADGGVSVGIPRDLATRMAAQVLIGSGKMVLEGGAHPGELKDRVCSSGGCSIAGVAVLQKGGFRGLVIAAAEAATSRVLKGQ